MRFGRLLARLFIGGMFIGHGTQKLFGWFDGPGIDGTTGVMDSLGLAPARTNAYAAALTETLGGVGIALGALTPAAAASLIGTMTTAIRTVHLKNGFWSSGGGYEYNLTIVAALAAGVAGSTVTLAAARSAHAQAADPAAP
jgi:putative oxidoreductase